MNSFIPFEAFYEVMEEAKDPSKYSDDALIKAILKIETSAWNEFNRKGWKGRLEDIRDRWEDLVTELQSRGLELPDRDKQPGIEYSSKTYEFMDVIA